MQIVIISYRRDYDTYHCGYREGGNRSHFETTVVEDTAQAANWIADQLRTDENAEFAHLVFARWEDFAGWAERNSVQEDKGEESISCPGSYDDSEEGDNNEERRGILAGEIRDLTRKRLGELSQAAKQRAEEVRHKEYEAQMKRQKEQEEARDRAEFERLSKKFQPQPKGQ